MPTDDTLPDKISEYLAEAFHGLLSAEGPKTLESFEDEALALAARAYGMALDRRDLELRAALPEGARAHDRRLRALATGLGDVEFRATRCLDRLGLPAPWVWWAARRASAPETSRCSCSLSGRPTSSPVPTSTSFARWRAPTA